MNNKEFEIILRNAVNGNSSDIEEILKMYMPLINKMSYVDGRFDEDLKQVLMLHVFKNIHKFPMEL